MSKLSDRANYLRGLAAGMELPAEKNETKLITELLELIGDMAQKIEELDADIGELDEYVESIDDDLSDMEETLFGDEEHDHDDEDGEDEEYSPDMRQPIAFDCPNCGQSVTLKAEEIDFEESPLCPKCGKPFFPDVIEGEGDDGDDED